MLKVDRFGPVFKQIHDALEKNANNLLRADDLTMAQVHLLFLLEESPDGCYSLKELERRLRVAQSTMVGVVKRSAQKGFVECYGDPHDKRVKHVRITPEGRRICAAAHNLMGESEERFLKGISPAERALFLELLYKVLRNLS